MKNKILGTVLASIALFGFAGLASAATIGNVLFDNGSGSSLTTPGSTVTMNMYVNMSSSEAVEDVYVRFPGATGEAGQGKCYTLTPVHDGDASPMGGWLMTAQVDVPQHIGSFPVQVFTHGILGDAQDYQCTSPTNGSNSFPNRITVQDVNSTGSLTTNSIPNGTGTGGTVTPLDQLTSVVSTIVTQMQQLSCQVNHGTWTNNTCTTGTSTTTPTVPQATGICTQLANAMLGAQMGVRTSGNVTLQGFLLYQHQSIPALAAGASFGFWGPQTDAALTNFKLQNQCN